MFFFCYDSFFHAYDMPCALVCVFVRVSVYVMYMYIAFTII